MNLHTHSGMELAEAPRAEHDPDEIDLLQYWQIVRDRRWLIVGIAAAVFALALVFTLLATPIYRASSTLQIERDTMKIVSIEALTPTESPNDRDFYQTQYELLQSRSLALRVVQDLKLTDHPQFADLMAAVDESTAKKAEGGTPGPNARKERERALVDELLDGLTIEPVRNSRLVRVNVDSSDPALAARLSNAYADAFIASNLERRFDASSYARKYLEERLAQLKGRLEDSEKALVDFATQEQIVSVGDDKPSLSAQNLSELNAALAKTQDQRIQAEAEWTQASLGDGLGLPQVVSNQLIQRLREQRSKLQGEYQEKLRTFKPDYPDMQRLSGQIAEFDRQIDAEIANIRASIKARFDAAQAQESLLIARISGLKGDVLDLQGRSIQYNILRREAETNRELYEGLLQRYKEIGVVGNVGTNNISVIDRAEAPRRRHSPRLSLNLAVGLLLGGFAGVLAAFLVHHLDRTIPSPTALAAASHHPLLGTIPKLPAGITPATAAADLRSAFAESYRSVRTALQFATAHGLPRSLFITSAAPSEGKSTTAMELARNIAQLGKRVVLIDADLRSPSIHRLTGLGNGVGLSNVLAGSAVAMEAVQQASDPHLSVITSGPLPPNPPELLAGERLPDLLEQLQAHFDVVVLDGPPVLGLADAPLLSHQSEATIVVAAAESTRKDALQGALQRLAATRGHVIGTVLTRFDVARKGEAHGYGGYAYYSYGAGKA